MTPVLPRIRHDIEITPVQFDGRRVLCLRDPQGISPNVTLVSIEALDALRWMDGQHTILDIQAELSRRRGQLVFSDEIRALVEKLDQELFLEGDRLQAKRQAIEEEFRNLTVRPAAFANLSYPAETGSLRKFLDDLFMPGEAGDRAAVAEPDREIESIIAPHIDLRVGGPCYVPAYRALKMQSRATTLILLGTSHYGTGELFVATTKDFETPLGTLQTDRGLLFDLERRLGRSLTRQESLHRTEHSLEFQAIFLKYIWGDRPLRIVPILVTSFHRFIASGDRPLTDPEIASFVHAIKGLADDRGDSVGFVAGADLAHVGPKFGDSFAAQSRLTEIESEDRALLEYATRVDAEEFFDSLAMTGDDRKVCGFPPIYTLLACSSAHAGQLLQYDQWSEEPTSSAVTYASLALYR